MQKFSDYSGDDECHGGSIYPNPHESSFFLSMGCHVNVYFPPQKRSRITAPIVFCGEIFKKQQTTIEVLPDECLFEIFRRISGRKEKSSCAAVSKRWLMLLSAIRKDEIHSCETAQPLASEGTPASVKTVVDCNIDLAEDLEYNDGCLTRCLEGKKATDVRLAAIAVGTCGRGGLGKLSIRENNASGGVTNLGLKFIARGCPSLRSLSLWNLSSIGDEGLIEIANECHMLEKLDLSHCPEISDKSLLAIANSCPNLTSLAIESCSHIGNESLQAIARGCSNLKYISIKACSMVGDQGIASLMSSVSCSLTKVKLEALSISDISLAVIGHYGKSVTDLAFVGLRNVTEKGFWVMGNGQGLQKLRSFMVTSCSGVTDLGLEAVGKGCPNLKRFSLQKCAFLSDNGLVSFTKSALSLESLLLEECHRVTQLGIFGLLVNCGSKLKTLSVANCFGINDSSLRIPPFSCHSLSSLTIRNCPGFGDFSLGLLCRICPKLTHIEFTGLQGITDEGIIQLIRSNSEAGLTNVNLSGCVNLTDRVVSELSSLHGGTLEILNLDGCRLVTDASLVAIADNCLLLSELDVSKCTITDSGIAALACELMNLQVLSVSGSCLVSDRSFPSFQKLGETLVGLNLCQCRKISNTTIGLLTEQMWKCDILS